MPDFTITLTTKAVTKLNIHVQRTNDTSGTNLTLKDWIVLHLKEMAIGDSLATVMQALREQHELDARDALQAAIDAAREQLLQEL